MKISSSYFGPGSPKKRFLRIFRNFFTKKWAGIRNHEWDDGNPESKSETTGALDPRVRRRKSRNKITNCEHREYLRLLRAESPTHPRCPTIACPRRPSFHSWIQGARRFTLGSKAPVVSLLDPGFPSSHSRFLESSSHSRFPYSGFFSWKFPEKS